jgi:RNA polymerase sigma factor (sigma-70 family)
VGSDETYLAHRPLIDRAIGAISRRQRLASVDAEDFAGLVRLHLLDDDCAVLRKFEGRSSLKTYLVSVITHLYQDWRNARWGKWRPSAEAKRLGPLAIHLERLIVRDRLGFDEAHEILRTNFKVTDSRQSLEAMAAQFPARTGRHLESDEALADLEASDARTDALLREREARDAARCATAALGAALKRLAPQDRIVLKMRFEDDFAIMDIARALHLDHKRLYRRIGRLLTDLRGELERAGITAASAAEVLEQRGFDRLRADAAGREMRDEVRPLDDGGRSPVGTARTP